MSGSIISAFEKKEPQSSDQQATISYPYLVCENEAERCRLEQVLDQLRQSETGKKLIEDALEHKTAIRLDAGMRAYGSYDEVSNNLKINANSDFDRQVGTMAHELRHAQQFQTGILMDAYLVTPKSYIHNQAAIEADASATSAAVCFELALKGNDKPLEALRSKDAHIVNPFQNAAVQGGLLNGEAYKAAFKGWFTNYSIRDSYDSLYVRMVQQRDRNCTREEEDKRFERVVPVNDIVQKVCSCNGKPYLSEKETTEFFSTPDANTVSFEPFNAIYRNGLRKYHFDWSKPIEEMMEKQFGLFSRPHAGYMPAKVVPEALPIPTVDARQAEAAAKIAAGRKGKESVAVENKLMTAALIRKKTEITK